MTTTIVNPSSRSRPVTATSDRLSARYAGAAALTGVVLSLVGVVFNQVLPGVDVFAAMQTGSAAERADLLTKVAEAQTSLVVGFTVWMVAFPAAAIAPVLLARLGRASQLTTLIRVAATACIGAIIVSLSMFIAFVVAIAPAHAAGEDVLTLAHAVGFTATTIDWVISAVVLGLGPATAIHLGRDIWAPRWLQVLAGLGVVLTGLEILGLLIDERALAMPLVPAGLAMLAGSGVCALRHGGRSAR